MYYTLHTFVFSCGLLYIITFATSLPCDVTVSEGSLRGETVRFTYTGHPEINTTVDVFTGIPYAEPPIGNNRFGKPVPKDAWQGRRNATSFGPICWQVPDVDIIPPQSEDCLYLNIWSPSVHRTNIPVMVWIHGGAFIVGHTIPLIYDGRPLVAYMDVVVVSIQYRLNGYGFLTTGDEVLPGNYGLWDQNLALKWIKNNIRAFGGDPKNITIFGQSAGGASVGFHLLQPSSWTYFNRAIMMSGSMLNPGAIQLNTTVAIETAYKVGRRSGCDVYNSEDLASCLRGVDEYALALAMDTTILKLEPIVDGEFITDAPLKLVQRRHFKNVPILLGTTLDDGMLTTMFTYWDQILNTKPYSDRDDFRERIRGVFTFANELILDAIEQEYVDWAQADDPSANYFFTYMDIETDETFLCTQDIVSREYVATGNDVYRYVFTHLPRYSPWPRFPTWKGVAHGDDIAFAFGSAFLEEFNDKIVPRDEIELSIAMMAYYSNFAKTGDPNRGNTNVTAGSIWEQYTLPSQTFKELKPGLPDITAYRASYCAFWNDVIPGLVYFKDGLLQEEEKWRDEFIEWKYEILQNWREMLHEYEETKDGSTCQ